MDKLTAKYSTHARALPPQRIKLEKPGWAGAPDLKMVDGSEPQPWHCLPFVEAATYGLELVYPYETECHVVNDNGDIRFEFDYTKEPGGVLTGGEFITFFPKPPEKFYLFNTRVDIQAPPGHVLRTEPHPRAFADETGTAPLAICGHVQSEWWTRKLFVVFKSPLPGQRHIFRKGDPYVQILFVPHRVSYETQEFTPEEETARRKRETQVDAAKLHMSTNIWKNPSGNEFSDYYKILARAFQRQGHAGVDETVAEGTKRLNAGLPIDKPIAEALAEGFQRIREEKYNDAKAIYQHVLSRDPGNAEAMTNLGICAACAGAPMVGLKLMNQAVAQQPNNPTYHNNVGELLRMMGQLPEAERAFRRSLRLNPRDAGVLSTLGQTIAEQGRVAEGLAAIRSALAISPNAAAIHFRLGNILAGQKQYAEARAAYEAALAADPNFVHATRALRELPAGTK
jgi:tetratricopeptide (TPR) repeat protein